MYRLIIALLLCSLPAAAQYSISGKVVAAGDTSGLPGVSATVVDASGSVVAGVVSDERGAFELTQVAGGAYTLKLGYIGYQQLVMPLVISASKVLGTLKLNSDTRQLKGVTVTGQQILARQDGDTMQFNANGYKVNVDATTEDLIKKMPGVTSDANGVKVNGEDVKQVLVDGKPFFGNDPSATLKNMPADMIDRVEVFDNMSDQAKFTGFDDGQSQKTINLVTRSDRRTGQFGRIYGGDGTDSRYLAGGIVNAFDGDRRISVIGLFNNVNQQNFSIDDVMSVMSNSGQGGPPGGGDQGGSKGTGASVTGPGSLLFGQQSGITETQSGGANYTDSWGKKIKVSGSYFFNYTDNNNHTDLTRNYFTDTSAGYNQHSDTRSKNLNHRANLRLEYDIDSNNNLTVVQQLRYQDNHYHSTLYAETLSDSSYGTASTGQATHTTGYAYTGNALYQHRFGKKGRTLSFNASTQINNSDGDGSYTSSSTLAGAASALDQRYSTVNRNYTLTGNLAYTEPVGHHGQLQASYSPSVTNGHSDKATNDLDGTTQQYTYFDTSLSNKYNSTYTTHSGGLAYRYNQGRLNFTVGANVQASLLDGEQQFPYAFHTSYGYTSLLPTAMLNYKFSKTENLHIMYRASTSSPSLTQLQEVVDISNPLLPKTGNASLQQQTTHNLMVRYGHTDKTKGRSFFLFATAKYAQNYISNQTITLRDDTVYNGYELSRGSQLTRPVNVDGYLNAKTFGVYGFPLKFIHSNLNLNGGASYTRTPALVNDVLNQSDNYTVNGGIYLGSNISSAIDFSLAYNGGYNTVRNSVSTAADNNYYNHTASFKINWTIWKGLVLNTDITHYQYTGTVSAYDQSYFLWNAYVAYKFMRGRAMEVKISLNDLLNQNVSVNHTVSETYVENSVTRTLRRYAMLSLTYTLKNFKHGAAPENKFEPPPGMPPPGSMQGPPPGMPPPGGG